MTERLGRGIIFSAITLGATSIVSQAAILRELLVVFYGNEFSIGIALACWLFWIAIGSWTLGKYAERAAKRPQTIVLVQSSAALLIPTLFFLSRSARNMFSLSPGEILGTGPVLLSSTAVLAPLCLALGFTFALLCASRPREMAGAPRVGSVYVLEAVGSMTGGFLFSLVCIRLLTPTETSFILGGLNLVAATITARSIRIRLLPISLLIGYITVLSLGATEKLENAAIAGRWRGLKVEYNANSIYGNVTVISVGGEKAFYESGLLSFSTGDDRSAEETAHIPLLTHGSPRRVLLVGGGMSGVLAEILKHPVESVTYIELDPLVVEAARAVLPHVALSPLDDGRVDLVFDDGRRFVKATEAHYDVVILNVPDPLTALVNRFYSREFFQELKRVVEPEGVVSLGLTLAENYLNPEQQSLLACIHGTVSSSFTETILIPGDHTYILASSKRMLAKTTPQLLLDREVELALKTDFIREGYLPFRMEPARTAFFLSSMERAAPLSLNLDLEPRGYFYATVAWLTRLDSRSASLLQRMSEIRPFWYLLPFVLLFGGLLWPTMRTKGSNAPVLGAVFTTGYAEMVFQVVVIYSFQVFFGFLYYRLGIILTSFMVGLAAGGFLMTLRVDTIREPGNLFTKLQVAMCVYPVLLAGFILLIMRFSRSTPLTPQVQTAFAFLPAVAGFLGGVQFPLAARICVRAESGTGRTAGYLYGVDLLGACAGAVLASALLVPVIGVLGTCLTAFAGSFASLLLIVISSARRRLRR